MYQQFDSAINLNLYRMWIRRLSQNLEKWWVWHEEEAGENETFFL